MHGVGEGVVVAGTEGTEEDIIMQCILLFLCCG